MKYADEKIIENLINEINQFNATPEFGTTRVLFTKQELASRKYIKNKMCALGLSVTEDCIGNIFATLKGTNPELSPVWTGSHIDTVPNAGKFDGMAGIVAGLEALRIIKESGEQHKRNITLVVYTSEEPTRFGLSCLGSRALSGDLDTEVCKQIFDKSGRSLYDKLIELGYDAQNIPSLKKSKGDIYASVELHIEQSVSLEKNKKTIGIVDKICAPSDFTVEVIGRQSHAGGTSMKNRRDAFAAASEMSVALENLAKKCTSEYNTATIGLVTVVPGAVNVIPGKCTFTVDLRDCNKETKDKLITEFTSEFYKIADKRHVQVIITEECNDTPLTCSQDIKNIIQEICIKKNISFLNLVSGAYHDTLFVGKFAPSAMIFVPSKNGISHSPEEWTNFSDIAKGTDVLADTLLKLSNNETELN